MGVKDRSCTSQARVRSRRVWRGDESFDFGFVFVLGFVFDRENCDL